MTNSPRYGITIPFDGISLADHRPMYTQLADLGYTDVWSAETDGADGFTPLALAAAWEERLNLGVAIAPVYTRGPALLAQTAAAMAEVAPGRVTIGLGASSPVIVQNWNGIAYDEPFKRNRCAKMGCPVLAANQSKLSASVVNPVLIFLVLGSLSSSKSTTCSCLGEPILNS